MFTISADFHSQRKRFLIYFYFFLNDELIFSSARFMESLHGLGWGLIISTRVLHFLPKGIPRELAVSKCFSIFFSILGFLHTWCPNTEWYMSTVTNSPMRNLWYISLSWLLPVGKFLFPSPWGCSLHLGFMWRFQF